MHADTLRVLKRTAAALHTAGIRFQLGGSGLLYAHGLVDRVGDLDLVFPDDARTDLADVLVQLSGTEPGFGTTDAPGFASSWRCLHRVEGRLLDMTGGDAVMVGGRRVELPLESGGEWKVDEVQVPLAPPATWWLIYRVHGIRERAEMLAGLAGEEAIAGFLDRLGVDRADVP